MTAAKAPLIVHVVFRLATGGLENGVVNLINRLPAARFRHAVLAIDDIDEAFVRRIDRDDVDVHALRKPPGHAWRLYPRIHRLLRAWQPSIVHSRNLAALEAQVPAALAGVPVRIHGEHGRDVEDLYGSNRRLQRVRRLYGLAVHRHVAVSQDLALYLTDRVGIRAERVEQIYNGVDTVRFFPAEREPAALAGCPFEPGRYWLAGTVGRLQQVKNQSLLLRAFARALALRAEMQAEARLVIAGEGPLRAELEAIAHDLDLGGRVWFAGERADAPEVLRTLRLFVLPSLAEGVSNTILEAMATGVPVLATAVGGNVELVEPGVTGELVRAEDVEAMAAAIAQAHADPERLYALGRAARTAAEQRFSLDAMVARYTALYEGELSVRMSVGR